MRRTALSLLSIFVVVFAGIGGLGAWRIHQLTRADRAGSDESVAIELAARVVANFKSRPPLSRYYGAFYSARLPHWAQLPVGLLEAVAQPSDCDSMVRGLIFALARRGIAAQQVDYFSPRVTHTVVEATIDGRGVLLDPYLNIVFRAADGNLASPQQAVSPAFNAKAQPLLPGGPPMRENMYRDYLRSGVTAALYSGKPGLIPVWIDASRLHQSNSGGGDTVINAGDAWDKAGSGVGITFLGPRYGRLRGKLLEAEHLQPNEMLSVTFTLSAAAPSALTSHPSGACRSAGKRVTCELPPAGPDGRAELRIDDGRLPTVYWVTKSTARLVR